MSIDHSEQFSKMGGKCLLTILSNFLYLILLVLEQRGLGNPRQSVYYWRPARSLNLNIQCRYVCWITRRRLEGMKLLMKKNERRFIRTGNMHRKFRPPDVYGLTPCGLNQQHMASQRVMFNE